MTDEAMPRWSAKGLLFENCSCQIVCPGHVHFSQLCTYERCLGYWAMRFDEGEFDGVPLRGVKAVAAFDSPKRMIDGNWTGVTIIDEGASEEQRRCVDALFAGEAGGPWAVLMQFVSRRLPTRTLPITIEDLGTVKRVRIEGILESSVEQIRGRDRDLPVTFENIFNQIHAPTQVIASGVTRYDDGEIVFETDGTHGLWSTFEWSP